MGKFKDIDTELQEFKRQAENMSQKDLIDDYAHLRQRESELEEQVIHLEALLATYYELKEVTNANKN